MKKLCASYCFVWIVAFLALATSPGRAAEPLLIDGVAAHVNDHTITIGDVMSMIVPVRRQLMRSYTGAELLQRSRAAFKDALDTLIARRLIIDLYEKQERIQIPEWLVDSRVDEILKDMFNNDRAAMMTALSKDHLTFEGWRSGLREHMIVSYMRRYYVDENISVPPNAVREQYDKNIANYHKPSKVRLRMIVMKKGPSAETADAKREQAREIHVRAKAGVDFGALAREVSEGSRASEGGDWGWIEPRMLRSELAEVVMKLKPAEVSDVIEIEDEFYLLKLEGRQNEAVRPFEDVQPEIERELRKARSDEMYKAWIERLKAKAYVEVFDVNPFVDAGKQS